MKKMYFFIGVVFMYGAMAHDNPCFKDYSPLQNELNTWAQDMVNPYRSSSSIEDDLQLIPLDTVMTVNFYDESNIVFHGISEEKPILEEVQHYAGLF